MAPAPGHLLGQIIGNALEKSLEPLLAAVAKDHGLYLDRHGRRPTRSGTKVQWTDGLGNKHDLDFVLERGGTETRIGRPAAFVESAWRRYTKHSRAKAQEIQGALLPLLAEYSDVKPFAGAVVAGRWTSGALQQLRTSGFAVLHVGYDSIVAAFAEFGIDVGGDEATSDANLLQEVERYRALTQHQWDSLARALCAASSDGYLAFKASLEAALARRIVRVIVIALRGETFEFTTIPDAIAAVNAYDTASDTAGEFIRFEIHLTYSNADSIVAAFENPADASSFMRSLV